MNATIKQQLTEVTKEIEEATADLALAFIEYQKRQAAAQRRLSLASCKLSSLNSIADSLSAE